MNNFPENSKIQEYGCDVFDECDELRNTRDQLIEKVKKNARMVLAASAKEQ